MDSNTGPTFNFNPGNPNSKKRSYQEFMLSKQLMHRFKAKSDFIAYFSEGRKFKLLILNVTFSVALRSAHDHDEQGLLEGHLG